MKPLEQILAQDRVLHASELDQPVADALTAMVTTTPTVSEIGTVMAGITRRKPSSSITSIQRIGIGSKSTMLGQISWATAAAVTCVLLATLSSSDAWGQVATNLSSPNHEPQSISTLVDSAVVAPTSPSASTRFILLAHVLALCIGIAGMFASWLTTMFVWLRSHWSQADRQVRIAMIGRRILATSLAIYSLAVVLGCLWSQATWGRPWSWDPRETFGLLTIGMNWMWLSGSRALPISNASLCQWTTRYASSATLAFGLTVLMWILGSVYAAKLHANGLPSMMPNIIAGFFGFCWFAVWLSGRFRERSLGKTQA